MIIILWSLCGKDTLVITAGYTPGEQSRSGKNAPFKSSHAVSNYRQYVTHLPLSLYALPRMLLPALHAEYGSERQIVGFFMSIVPGSMAFPLCVFLLGIARAIALVLNKAQTIPNVNTSTLADSRDSAALNTPLEIAGVSLWNASTPSTSLINSTTVRYRCDGNDFGFDIATLSCIDAITNSIFKWDDTDPKTWGPRHTRIQYDFPLPQRFISRE